MSSPWPMLLLLQDLVLLSYMCVCTIAWPQTKLLKTHTDGSQSCDLQPRFLPTLVMYVIAPARHTHTLRERQERGAGLSQGEGKKIETGRFWKLRVRVPKNQESVCVCMNDTVTDNMWGAEGGRCGEVNGNHQSQWSSDTQQESLSPVYTCCYTHTHIHSLIHTWSRARWLGKHNLGGCCCCFKASQRVHKLS